VQAGTNVRIFQYLHIISDNDVWKMVFGVPHWIGLSGHPWTISPPTALPVESALGDLNRPIRHDSAIFDMESHFLLIIEYMLCLVSCSGNIARSSSI